MACAVTGKRRYRSLERAIAAIGRSLQRYGVLGRRPLNAYFCEACERWHVGHRPLVLPAAVTLPDPAPVPKQAEAAKCACACKKPATEIVTTPTGTRAVCKRHAKRLRATYMPVTQ
jgi:hypothetical protein